jgi:hypothetical protein
MNRAYTTAEAAHVTTLDALDLIRRCEAMAAVDMKPIYEQLRLNRLAMARAAGAIGQLMQELKKPEETAKTSIAVYETLALVAEDGAKKTKKREAKKAGDEPGTVLFADTASAQMRAANDHTFEELEP